MSSRDGFGMGVGLAGGGSGMAMSHQGPSLAGLLAMLAVLGLVFAYYCWGAPLCRRHCCCRRRPRRARDSADTSESVASGPQRRANFGAPTLILLPHGRMLVVDGTIFAQLQAENNGLDLVELGESVMRNASSQCSVIEMDAETPSKDSMGSIGCFPPPTYESIYGKDDGTDVPPSYSDILLHRFANLLELEMADRYRERRASDSKEELELRSPHVISNPLSGLRYGRASSRSLPRDPVIAGYHVDNELRPGRSRQPRRRCSVDDDRPQTSLAAARRLPDSDTDLDSCYIQSWDQSPTSQNDATNSRSCVRSSFHRTEEPNFYSRGNPHHVSPRTCVERSRPDEPVRVHRESTILSDQIDWQTSNSDLGCSCDEEERPAEHPDEPNTEDDPSNFQALADIRESRV